MSDARQIAHELIDQLPEAQLSGLVQFLETIVEPENDLRKAPLDGEPESEQERQAVAQAEDWLARRGGKGIPHDRAMRRLGLE